MKWRVFLPALILAFALGVLCMHLVTVSAMRGYLLGYLTEQAVRADARATAAACKGDVLEEALHRWSVVSFARANAAEYDRRHRKFSAPFYAALTVKVAAPADANVTGLDDLYRAKLIDVLERADHAALAKPVRKQLAGGAAADAAEIQALAARLIASECPQARPPAPE